MRTELQVLNSSNVTELKKGGKQSCKTTSKWKSRVMRKKTLTEQ
jgi:hypothetical protein